MRLVPSKSVQVSPAMEGLRSTPSYAVPDTPYDRRGGMPSVRNVRTMPLLSWMETPAIATFRDTTFFLATISKGVEPFPQLLP